MHFFCSNEIKHDHSPVVYAVLNPRYDQSYQAYAYKEARFFFLPNWPNFRRPWNLSGPQYTFNSYIREKKEEIWLMTKALKYPHECQRGNMTTQRRHQNNRTNTQRLRIDLGRTDRVNAVIQLVWLTGLRAQPSHSPQQPCNLKDTHLKICK